MQSGLAGRLPQWRRAAACSVVTLATAALAGCMAQQPAARPRANANTRSAATGESGSTAQTGARSESTASNAEPTTRVAVPPPQPSDRSAAAAPQESAEGPEGIILPGEKTTFPLTFYARGEFLYGPVSGNLQVPLGGKKGSSTGNQPHLNNIGIDDVNGWDGELGAGWDPDDQVFIGGQMLHLSGGDQLPKAFVSRGVKFPAGTPVESEVRLDWYRFGYRHDFALHMADNGIPDVTLTPWLSGLVWDFGYHLNGGKRGTVGRAFNEFGLQLGGMIAWRPDGGPLSFEAYAGSFPQIANMVDISVEGVRARYHFYQLRRADFSFILGAMWEQQDFKDSQKPLQNNIKIRMGPMLETGLQINF